MAKKNQQRKDLEKALRDVGGTLGQGELKSIAKDTKQDYGAILSRALKMNVGVGAKAADIYNQDRAANPYQDLYMNLRGLEGLRMPNKAVFQGQSVQRDLVGAGGPDWNIVSGSGISSTIPGAPNIYPIVTMRARGGGGGGGGKNGGGGGGNGKGNPTDGSTIGGIKNDGSFKNIQKLYEQQMLEAAAKGDKFAKKQVKQIQAMQVGGLTKDQLRMKEYELQMEMLNQQIEQDAYSNQRAEEEFAASTAAANAAYAEQARVASALGKAYVPDLERSAASVQAGDWRTSNRNVTNNALSNLAIVNNIGSSNSLSGLQLA